LVFSLSYFSYPKLGEVEITEEGEERSGTELWWGTKAPERNDSGVERRIFILNLFLRHSGHHSNFEREGEI
jgi:hypothetical protein